MSFTKDKKPVVAVISAVIVLLVVGMAAFFVAGKGTDQNTGSQSSELTPGEEAKLREPIKIDNYSSSREDTIKFVEIEGPKDSYARKKTQDTDPTRWDKETLDLAYTSLLYADKLGGSNQVSYVIDQIDRAQKAGLNIDDNSYGIDVKKRESIIKRAGGAIR